MSSGYRSGAGGSQVDTLVQFAQMLQNMLQTLLTRQDGQDEMIEQVADKFQRVYDILSEINRCRDILDNRPYFFRYNPESTDIDIYRPERRSEWRRQRVETRQKIREDIAHIRIGFADIFKAISGLSSVKNPEFIMNGFDLIDEMNDNGDRENARHKVQSTAEVMAAMYMDHNFQNNNELNTIFRSVFLLLDKVAQSANLQPAGKFFGQEPPEDQEAPKPKRGQKKPPNAFA